MTSATEAAAAKARKPQSKKHVSHAKPDQPPLPLPVPAAPEYGQMPIKAITVLEQVRKNFDENALNELAMDIALRGIIQPLIVRKKDDDYILVAGERRLRAAALALLESVPVIIQSMDEKEHELAQIAENIQRQDLTIIEEAAAIRKMHERGMSVQEISARVHKSKSWVSKRLSASAGNLHWIASSLLEDGITEDLEIILAVDKIARLDYRAGHMISDKIKRGEAGRQTVKDELEKVKAEREQAIKESEQREQEALEQAAERKKQRELLDAKEKEERRLSLDECVHRFDRWALKSELRPGEAWLMELDQEQSKICIDHLSELMGKGACMLQASLMELMLDNYFDRYHYLNKASERYTPIEIAALMWGRNTLLEKNVREFLNEYKSQVINKA